MEVKQDLPITRVCIVSDPSKCPPNHIVISRTYENTEEADLWRDKNFFGKRVTRYLCVERQNPSPTQDVLVDVSIINEKDNVPPGFHVLETTIDTKEKASQKKFICIRWMAPSLTADAITDLIFLSKKKPPQGYTSVGEINNMSLCYKMGHLPQSFQMTTAAPLYSLPQSTPLSLPYAISPVTSVKPLQAGHGTMTRTGPPEQSANSLATSHVNPISGIEWKMNQKYKMILELKQVTIPEIKIKSFKDIDTEHVYDFNVEYSVDKHHHHDLPPLYKLTT
ncbi:Multivesicular body subunit 12B [Bulinus truncatus]|nr:Multivesicular body subunit 12B [Bulinus truncatus]